MVRGLFQSLLSDTRKMRVSAPLCRFCCFVLCCFVWCGVALLLLCSAWLDFASLCFVLLGWALLCFALLCFAFVCLAFPCLSLPCLALAFLFLPCLAPPCLASPCLAFPRLSLTYPPCVSFDWLAICRRPERREAAQRPMDDDEDERFPGDAGTMQEKNSEQVKTDRPSSCLARVAAAAPAAASAAFHACTAVLVDSPRNGCSRYAIR